MDELTTPLHKLTNSAPAELQSELINMITQYDISKLGEISSKPKTYWASEGVSNGALDYIDAFLNEEYGLTFASELSHFLEVAAGYEIINAGTHFIINKRIIPHVRGGLSIEDQQKVYNLLLKDTPEAEISTKVGITQKTVKKYAERIGIVKKPEEPGEEAAQEEPDTESPRGAGPASPFDRRMSFDNLDSAFQ